MNWEKRALQRLFVESITTSNGPAINVETMTEEEIDRRLIKIARRILKESNHTVTIVKG